MRTKSIDLDAAGASGRQRAGWAGQRKPLRRDGALAAVGLAALAIGCARVAGFDALDRLETAPVAMSGPASSDGQEKTHGAKHAWAPPWDQEWAIGGYGGATDTLASTVTVKNGSVTDMTMSDFTWAGKPIDNPVYYGVRIQRWFGASTGAMLDFVHAKAIAEPTSAAKFTGSHRGRALPAQGQVNDGFAELEFSNGHNILTLNAMLRLPKWTARIRPYVGMGGGITLPHSEVFFTGDRERTNQYLWAGFAGQALGGLEVDLGHMTVFLEYKFTYAPYDIPLVEGPSGTYLVVDLWRQFAMWLSGEAPPGGRLSTTLVTHHAIAGAMFKSRPAP